MEQTPAMDQASSLRTSPPRSQHSPGRKAILCVAVASGKGGVGKTFLTVNLATTLARQNRRVLLVDADLGLPNADIILGAAPELTLEDCLFHGVDLADVVAKTPFGIDLLAANSGAREMVALGEARLALLAEDLIRFAGNYDVLLFDCASGIDASVTAFLAAAPQSIIVVQPDPTSLMDAYALIKVIRHEDMSSGISLVMNGIRDQAGGKRILAQLQSVVRDYLQLELDCIGLVPHSERAIAAMHARSPLVAFDGSDPAAVEISAVARRIIQKQRAATASGKLNAQHLLQGILAGRSK